MKTYHGERLKKIVILYIYILSVLQYYDKIRTTVFCCLVSSMTAVAMSDVSKEYHNARDTEN